MDKIVISDEDVNSSQVDQEVRRQDVANRMAQHQKQVMAGGSVGKTSFFRKAIVYMSIFGLIFSLLGWGSGEIVLTQSKSKSVKSEPMSKEAAEFQKFVRAYNNGISYNLDLDTILQNFFLVFPEARDNYYLSDEFWSLPESRRKKILQKAFHTNDFKWVDRFWYIVISLFITVGISIAEPFAGKNRALVLRNAFAGALFGALAGFLISLFINNVYHALGGGQNISSLSFQQIFARGVGWGLLGMLISIVPGIMLKSWKKLLLGLAGGAMGGLLGGMLFDPICALTGSDVPARCVNILGLGVGAAVATALLEDFAKQGWLKVATGLIAGKQFILYRNPTIIGSSPKTEIYLFKDPEVAPRHAALNRVGDAFLLNALENSPVYLNGALVRQQRLSNGDQIRIGKTVLIFETKAIRHS